MKAGKSYNPVSQMSHEARLNMRATLHAELGRCPYGQPCNCFDDAAQAFIEAGNSLHVQNAAAIGIEYTDLDDLLAKAEQAERDEYWGLGKFAKNAAPTDSGPDGCGNPFTM